jgi:hypothetical protein
MQRLILFLLAGVLPLLAQAQKTTSRSADSISSDIWHNAPWSKILPLILLMIVIALAFTRFRKSNP